LVKTGTAGTTITPPAWPTTSPTRKNVQVGPLGFFARLHSGALGGLAGALIQVLSVAWGNNLSLSRRKPGVLNCHPKAVVEGDPQTASG